MNLPNKKDSTIWRELIKTYWLPVVMFIMAITPRLNYTYSGHGGISWLIVPLCFPVVILRALIKINNGSEPSRSWYKRFFKISIPLYFLTALPLSWAATASLRATFGLPVSPWRFFALMVSPIPWWYFTWFQASG
jgi:hypothetical protein